MWPALDVHCEGVVKCQGDLTSVDIGVDKGFTVRSIPLACNQHLLEGIFAGGGVDAVDARGL